eukprot:321491-Rhodomonas_salina.2
MSGVDILHREQIVCALAMGGTDRSYGVLQPAEWNRRRGWYAPLSFYAPATRCAVLTQRVVKSAIMLAF